MSKQKYASKDYNPELMARALGKALPISTKQSVEVCSFIRNKSVKRAKEILNDAIIKKSAIPFKRYCRAMGHKPGKMSVGKYPVKTCQEILAIINSAEANAQFKGLNTSNLVITHICAQKCSNQWHYGRLRRRMMKRTHIEIVLEEKAVKKEKPKQENKKDNIPKHDNQKDVKPVKKTETEPKKEKVQEKKSEDKKQETEAKK